ncbi:MAG TPA: hypothetical protein VF711_10915 [Acidimicrobiales bacterium]
MELPEPHRLAVQRLIDLLPLREVNWALTGSVAHRLQGADLECRDVDVQTDEHDAYEVAARLNRWVVERVALRSSAQIQSHFGRLHFDDLGLDVEVMGAIRKRTPEGLWGPPTDPAHHRMLIPFGVHLVPVLSLHYEAEAYEALGRRGRAAILRGLAPDI